jgi:hypothetical protein
MNQSPTSHRRRVGVTFAVALSAGLLAPSAGHALEEDAFSAGGGLGVTLLNSGGRTGVGPFLEVSASHGITDVWALHVGLGFQACRFAAEPGHDSGWQAGFSGFVGLRVAYDVLRVVPFAQLGASVAGLDDAGPTAGTWLGPEGALGAEYLIDRDWSLAPTARVRVLPLRLSGSGGGDLLFGADLNLWVGRRF